MAKVYNVWVASNAYGGREDHCGFVRAADENDAFQLAHDYFRDSIRTSLSDKSVRLEHLYVTEWTPGEDAEGEPRPEPVCQND
jgi:hypothetical protein